MSHHPDNYTTLSFTLSVIRYSTTQSVYPRDMASDDVKQIMLENRGWCYAVGIATGYSGGGVPSYLGEYLVAFNTDKILWGNNQFVARALDQSGQASSYDDVRLDLDDFHKYEITADTVQLISQL